MRPFGAGWYNDPHNPLLERYWDGRTWTTQVRKDVPDIPLAPWVDPSHPDAHVGYHVDTTPPKASVGPWLALVAGAIGVSFVFLFGFLQTSATIEAQNATIENASPSQVQDPPSGGGDLLKRHFSCLDVSRLALDMERRKPTIGLTSVDGSIQAVKDNQPIGRIPPAGKFYRVVTCEGPAEVQGQSAVTLKLDLTITPTGALFLFLQAYR